MRAILALLVGLAMVACAPAKAEDSIAITDVTVVPMDADRLLQDQTVIVRDGRIAALGPSSDIDVPAGATRIEGRGRYLMPGLAEMHAHVPPDPADAQQTEDVLFLYVASGVTFARSMLGAPHHLELRARAERGEILSPRILASGPSFNGNSVASPEDARRMVREQKAAGYDFLKIHPGLDRARYDAMAEAARAAGIEFAGHVPEEVGLERALEVGQASVDHLDGYVGWLAGQGTRPGGGFFGFDVAGRADEARIAEIARRTREAGVWNVPTESLLVHMMTPDLSTDALLEREEMRYMPPQTLASWREAREEMQRAPNYDPARAQHYLELRRRLIKALHDAGAGLLLGSDAPQLFNVPGFSLLRELRYMVDAGLTPYQALATGTVNVARFLGTPGEFGTVAVGARADLILLDADPLLDVANLNRRAGVMVNGRWIAESEIRQRLDGIAARHRG